MIAFFRALCTPAPPPPAMPVTVVPLFALGWTQVPETLAQHEAAFEIVRNLRPILRRESRS